MPTEDSSAPNLLRNVSFLKQYAPALGELGYTTVEDFFGVLQIAADAVAGYLHIDVHELLAYGQEQFLQAFSENTDDEALRSIPFSAGVPNVDPPAPQDGYAPTPPTVPLPGRVNLSREMPPLRYQGDRATCVAFAAIACCEHAFHHVPAFHGRSCKGFGGPDCCAHAGGTPHIDLSEQFLYWACKQIDGYREQPATFLKFAADSLRDTGCCSEADWPYWLSGGANESYDPPPSTAFGHAGRIRMKALDPQNVTAIKAALAGGRCVAVSLMLFENYERSLHFASIGKFPMPLRPDMLSKRGHAVCLVGYEDRPGVPGTPGGGVFILRNSWGPAWGSGGDFGPGHGFVFYEYVARYCREAYVVDDAREPNPTINGGQNP